MKRVWSIILVLAFLAGIMQIGAFAEDKVVNLVPENGEYEVQYFIPNDLSPNTQAQILAYMRGEDTEPNQDRNIICTLFGHDFTTTTTSSVTHNVYTTSPKCVRNTYETRTCTRCGHVETELIDSVRISTCHG